MKYFPFAASLAFQMVEFYTELWLSGAVTPARCSEESRKILIMRTLDIYKRYRHQNGLVLLLFLAQMPSLLNETSGLIWAGL